MIHSSKSTSTEYLSEENKNTNLKRKRPPNVNCSVIYNSPKGAQLGCPCVHDWWTYKEDMIHTHTRTYTHCNFSSVQFSSVAQLCPTLCNPMNCSMPGLPVHHQLPEFTHTLVHRVGDAIQPSHPLSSPSPPAPNPYQHQSLFQWVNSSHEVAKVLEFQRQHQSFRRTPRTDLL